VAAHIKSWTGHGEVFDRAGGGGASACRAFLVCSGYMFSFIFLNFL
jgi:hypothetical protein